MLTLTDQRVRSAIAGGLGGAAGWLLVEPLVAPRLQYVASVEDFYPIDALFGALAGICIGAALGIAEGVVVRSAYQARRGGLIGASAGIIGGAIGLVIGEMVYQPLKLCCFVGRSVGWAVFGAFLGAAEGITRRSWRGLRSAALGGTVGGAIGGFMFDLVGIFAVLLFRSDALSRGVALIILGACIGLWIVIMERQLSPAILKVVSGRFEGREFFLDKPRLTIGSDERGDIALFGDPQIRGHHATLVRSGPGYVIEAAPAAAVLVNKQAVSRQSLLNEDEVILGNTRLIYRDRSGATGRTAAVAAAPAPLPGPSPSPGAPKAAPAWQPESVLPQPPTFLPLPSSEAGTLALIEAKTGQRYALRSGVTTIGRAPDNDVVLTALTVSGYHAEVRFEDGRYVLYDKNSRNGTFVNGRRIAGPNMIKAGWRVTIGDVEFLVGTG
jgi:pSer/pThr/pTyr-binding forkhead associated (FHA) protein